MMDPQVFDDYGLDDLILTDCRRYGVRQQSFAEFIALAASDDERLFLIVPDVQGGHRPVDLISTLDMAADEVTDAVCKQLSLDEYLSQLKDHVTRSAASER